MKRIAVLLLLGLMLPLTFAQPCDVAQLIFRASDTTNAHAELWNEGNYPEEICYNTIFGTTYDAAGDHHACTGSNTVLWASAKTNAHVEEIGLTPQNYSEPICFGDFECSYLRGAPNCASIQGSKCIGSISTTVANPSNGHFSTVCLGPGRYDTVICCKSSSEAPTAYAGLDRVTESGETVTLNGTCSDLDGTISSCSWSVAGCVTGALIENGIGTANATTSIDVTCSGNLGDEFTLTLTAVDNAGKSGTDSAIITITEFGSNLKIVQLSATPLAFGSTGSNFASITVKAQNVASLALNATLKLEVLNPTTNAPMSPAISATADCGSIAPGGFCQRSYPADFGGFDISLLNQGSYKLSASVWSLPSKVEDQKALFFTIQGPVPVPEFSELLLPLIAFSVLAIVFLAGKRKS